SAVAAFESFVLPLLCGLLGVAVPQRPRLEVVPVQPLPSKLGLEELIRVKLGRVGARVVAVPLKRGAGTITSLTRADGIVRVPLMSEGLEADAPVAAELLVRPEEIEGTIVCVGSHDNTLDVLADLVHRHDPELYLSSGHVGSLGGLMAVKRGQAHLCGTHLLDPATGDYNFSYLERYLADVPLYLVNLVFRDQGFIVPPGNPKGITGVEDLARDDVTLINRQPGAGTRILLDHCLAQAGLSAAGVNGYDQVEYTHMAVAVAVLTARADVGVGILAAARALELDFVPLIQERYDLVIPAEFWELAKLRTLLNVIGSDEFKRAVVALGGYGVDQTGRVLLDPSGRR
ncbi:MAG: molybdopterin biosynthesis protein, partial [Proteobacteria bacterium]|nr:molybdopterin biosynthesis protein [Pseudomonadota bacterium]